MASVRQVTLKPLSFNILPQQVSIKNGHKKLKLAAILQPQFKINGAQIIASLKDRKQKIHYSPELKKFIKKNNIEPTFFDPLVTYLSDQLTQAKKNPDIFLAILQTYLLNGQSPNFTVSFLVDNAPPCASKP